MTNSKTQEVIIQYNWDLTFDKQEERIIQSLYAEKEILRKIVNKMTQKVITEMLNKEVTPDYVDWFKKALTVFLSVFKG